MGRYQYICRNIEAYQHEYKLLIGGQITIDQLPEECVSGFLYFFLRQFIDFVQLKAGIDNQVEETDELSEDYYFDTYLGVMSSAEDKEYGKENMDMAAHNLIQTKELLEEASESMLLCIMENQIRISDLFERLWNNSTQALEFVGGENALKHAIAVPKSKKLLQFTLDDGTDADRTILSGIHAYYEPEELIGKTAIAIVNLPPRKMMGINSCGMLISAVHEEEGEEKLHFLLVDDHIPAGAKLY